MLTMAVAAAAVLPAALLEDDDAITVAGTEASATIGEPMVRLPSTPTASTSVNVMVPPAAASSFSTFRTALGVTRYCFPPVRMTANMGPNFPETMQPQGEAPRRPKARVIAMAIGLSTMKIRQNIKAVSNLLMSPG
jgi:hypothetical protein